MKITLEAQHEVITDLILEKKTEVINRKRECFKLHREIKDLSRQLDAIRGVLKANGGWIPGETLAESAARILKERVSRRAELEMWRDGNILHETHRDELQKVEQERDEAREARNECERQYQEKVAEVAQLLSERDEARGELHIAVGLLSTHPQFENNHPKEVLEFVKEAAK